MLKLLTVWIIANCGKFLKRWEYQTTWPAPFMQVKKQQLEPDMEQWTDSTLRKKHAKPVYCHPAYWTYMQNTSCKIPAGWVTSWIKVARRNINNLRYGDNTTLMAESEEELKSFFMNVKEESEKLT